MMMISKRIFKKKCHYGVGLQVEGPKKDLHSGGYGGVVIEPMTDLIGILGECILKHTSNHSVTQEGKTLYQGQSGLCSMLANVFIQLFS